MPRRSRARDRHVPSAPADAASPFPDAFRARMADMLGDELEPFLAALAAPGTGLRVNTLRLPPERFREIAPFDLEALPFPEEGFRVAGDARPGKHPFHDAGLYYLQDPGAMAVGALTDPRPGERVLDLAAAPGGKATHLAARMRGEGVLVANDPHPLRARELAGNLERCGVRNAVVLAESAERLVQRFGAYFDRVLLDAPCSGESMFHKSGAARADWSPEAVQGCARRQTDLIHRAADLVRPGGLLVYSTCTFAPEENEGVAAAFLAEHPDFQVERLDSVPGASAGRSDWLPADAPAADVSGTTRLWPHRVAGAGHFVAAFRRAAGASASEPPLLQPSAPGAARELFDQFRLQSLHADPVDERIAQIGTELYRIPCATPELDGLRVVQPGWWLGTPAKNRFEPSHALALALEPATARRSLELPSDSQEVRAYLRGETLRSAGEAGWVLITTGGFALGWGKRVGSTVKNHYPKGLRWRG